jgi:hypothetical protein
MESRFLTPQPPPPPFVCRLSSFTAGDLTTVVLSTCRRWRPDACVGRFSPRPKLRDQMHDFKPQGVVASVVWKPPAELSFWNINFCPLLTTVHYCPEVQCAYLKKRVISWFRGNHVFLPITVGKLRTKSRKQGEITWFLAKTRLKLLILV